MFRFWYYACRWSSVLFLLVFVCLATPAFLPDVENPWLSYAIAGVLTVSMGCLVGLGLMGALLGIWGCVWGIQSACPQCGALAHWEIPERNYLAIECEKCGLIGGNLLKDFRPRFLREFYEETDDPEGT